MKPKNSLIPKNTVIELTIDSLSYSGGRGVGRHQGLVVFVPNTAPGDIVRARVTTEKPRYWEAEVVEILTPSKHRRKPPCPVVARCGGCSWQHVNYDQQVEQKKKILSDSLRKVAARRPFEWLPFLPAPEEFHYRNRIQIHFKNGQKGFFAKGSNDLVAVEHCHIAEPQVNVKLKAAQGPEGGRLELGSGGAGFAQVNSRQNEILKARVVEMPAIRPDWIMDLYCGSGNLTFPLARRFPAVPLTAVELSRAAVAQGRELGVLLEHIDWQAADVGAALAEMRPRQGVGLAVLDPPRPGCDKRVIEELLRHAPQEIIYVSCNPATFARDCERLMDGGYELRQVQGLDMFPQTEHVELLARLSSVTVGI